MKYTVNGRFQGRLITGVQRYAREITERIADSVEVVSPRNWLAGVGGHLWEQGVLPRLTRGGLLWSPCNTGPLAVGRQVVTIHDCAFVDCPEGFSRAFGAWYRWLIPQLVRRVRRIIAVSRFTASRLAELCGLNAKRIEVIPNGVDSQFHPSDAVVVDELRRRLALPERYVLSVGTLEPRKNLRRLLASWEQLPAELGDVGLVVAGAKGRQFCSAGIEQLPAGVRLTGYVEDADLPALYSGAEAFIYPSVYEGFGMPVLEAMSCGTAVICSGTTSLPEVAGDAALLVDPCDTESIAGAISRLLNDAELRRDFSARGLERAKQFSWDRTARATAEILRQTAAED
jgi:glycosyltransferase involved in cell wall biosynthesis